MKTETPRKYIPRAERCCTCGRPRGLAQKRRDWGLQCPTAMIPHTPNPAEHGDQITNDIICNAGIWRNGGSDGDTHLCDDCLRVGLRVLKLKIDEALEVVEAGADQRAELSGLTQRLAELQHHHQWLAYEHNRMQVRLGKMLDVIDAAGIAETDEIKHARFEVKRGPAIQKKDEYLWIAPAGDITDADRLRWLHTGGEKDADGCEWGVFRVKWDAQGRPVEVWQTNSDLSDLDAEIRRERSANDSYQP